MATLTKAELIEIIGKECVCGKGAAGAALDGAPDRIASALAQGDDVRLHGFGPFTRSTIKARTGRNPRTGETIEIPETPRVTFARAKALKARLAGQG